MQERDERHPPERTYLPYLIAAGAAAAVVILDQLSKYGIYNEIGPGGRLRVVDVVPGLKFAFVRNSGSAFGLFQGQSSLLTVLTFVAIGFLALFFIRNARNDPILAAAMGLMLGGAIGNLIDRLRYDYVIDFIKVPYWPTFNVADSAITVGVFMLLYTLLLRDIKRDIYTSRQASDDAEPLTGATGED